MASHRRVCIGWLLEPGRTSFVQQQLAARSRKPLRPALGESTRARSLIAISEADGDPLLRRRQEQRETELRNGVAAHPLVQAVLETFPGATITAVRERFAAADSEMPEGEMAEGDEPGGR